MSKPKMKTLYSLESSLGASGEKMKRSSGKETKSFPSFMEYMNAKGKMVEKPEIENIPDYHGPDDKFPPNSKAPYKTPVANKKPAAGESGLSELGNSKLKYEPMKGSNYEVKKDVMKEYMDDKGKVLERGREDIKGEYKGKAPTCPPGDNSKPYISSAIKPGEKGLGEIGNQELVYEPDTKNSPKIKTKTEGFLNKTKGMSLSEFTKYMLKECGCGQVEGDDLPYVTAYTSGKFQPHPPEVIRYISILADKNDGILQNLVGQMISMGYLSKLLKAIFEHPQAYEELVSLFGDENDGPSRCKSFAGAMNNSYDKFVSDQESMYESVSSPIGFEDEEDDKKRIHGHEDFEDEDSEDSDEDFEDEDSEDSDEDFEDEDSEDSDEDFEDEDSEGSDFEDEESEGSDEYEDFEDEDSEDSDEDFEDKDSEGSDEYEDFEDEDSEENNLPKQKKLKKKFAYDNLLDAMRNHEHMFKKMRGI